MQKAYEANEYWTDVFDQKRETRKEKAVRLMTLLHNEGIELQKKGAGRWGCVFHRGGALELDVWPMTLAWRLRPEKKGWAIPARKEKDPEKLARMIIEIFQQDHVLPWEDK